MKHNIFRILNSGTSFVILHSDYEWRKAREKHIEIETTCQMCETDKKLEVHHIVPWHVSTDLRYDPENLITLCRACHFRFGHYLNWKDFNPNIRTLCDQTIEIKRLVEN